MSDGFIVKNLSFHQMVESLIKVIELKDNYTAGHSDRVAVLSQKIAHYMGLDRNFCEYIHIAGHLHDIGKIGIPDGILLKTGKLLPEEYNLLKRHSVIGYEIFKDITDFKQMAEMIRWHHERFDGRGYPDGIRGENIPIGACIIAVADSYDAMTTSRPYKRSFSIEETVAELLENRGKQFHPDPVDAFITILKDEERYTGDGAEYKRRVMI